MEMSKMTATELALFWNLIDSQEMIDECKFNSDTNGVIRWAIVADTFAEMI